MDKAPIRAPVHSDSPYTSTLYRQFVQLRVDPTHQSVMANADTHLPVHHEGDAAEHLPFRYSRNVRQCRSHSVGQVLARGHGTPSDVGRRRRLTGIRQSSQCSIMSYESRSIVFYVLLSGGLSAFCEGDVESKHQVRKGAPDGRAL